MRALADQTSTPEALAPTVTSALSRTDRLSALLHTSGIWTTALGSARRRLTNTREDKRSSGQVRHVRMLGLCLIAVLALAVVAASSASAAGPEWGQCYAKAKGKYADSNCQTKAAKGAGEFEWRKGTAVAKKHFEGGGGLGVLTGEYKICTSEKVRKQNCNEGEEENTFFGGPLNVECETERNAGEASGKDGISNVSVVFRGCKVLGSAPCSNTEKEGEIRVNELKGELGYINKSTKEVGVLLQPVKKNGSFAQFGCLEGELTTVVGVGSKKEGYAYPPKGGNDGIVSPIEPVDQMTGAFTQTYTVNSSEENVPQLEKGKTYLLESYIFNAESPEYTTKWSKAGETITNTNTPEEEGEIKA